MDKALKKEWSRFLNGCWQMERPSKPGKYPIVSPLHPEWSGSTRILFIMPSTNEISDVSGYEWEGYWWSEPFPELPKLGVVPNKYGTGG